MADKTGKGIPRQKEQYVQRHRSMRVQAGCSNSTLSCEVGYKVFEETGRRWDRKGQRGAWA